MKLTKIKLLKIVNDELVKLGYKQIRDTVTGANGLFIKMIDDVYFLSLGFTISNYYESSFTAAYYLSKSTRWSAVWGDIPNQSYQRVGCFLKKEERILYLDNNYNKEGVIDSWWNGDDIGIKKFLEVIKITESRFLEQMDFFSKINNSKEIKVFVDYSSSVFDLIALDLKNVSPFEYTPKKNIDDIPKRLFEAAEKTLMEKGGILNANTVKALAADAWRQIQINYKLFFLLNKLK